MQCILISPHCSLYGCYFLFLLYGKNAGKCPCTLKCSFFFVPPKKNEPRKRRPPETPIPLRMPVMAKWAKLASLKQTPIFNAMPFILIVRQSRPTSHSRNGAVWEQMQTITDACMLKKLIYHSIYCQYDKVILPSVLVQMSLCLLTFFLTNVFFRQPSGICPA